MKKVLIVVLGLLLIAGCAGRNPNEIEPNPLPEIDREYQPKRIWSRNVGRGIGKHFLHLQPAVTAEGVYAADHRGLVRAFSHPRGRSLWRNRTGDRISGGVYAGYGMVLYGTRDGDAVALSADDGSELWRVRLSSEVLAAPVAGAGLALFKTIDGHVVALDIDSGAEAWNFDTAVPVLILRGSARPTVVGDRVYTAFANGKVVALDIDTGMPVWERRVAEPTGRSELERLVDISNNLIVEGGGVFASSFQGQVAVLDADGGRPFWGREMSTFGFMSSSAGNLYLSDSESHVWAIDQRSGEDLWKQDALYGRELTGTAVQRGQVVVGDKRGWLHWIDGVSGHITARRKHHRSGFASAPVVRDGIVYVYGRSGRLAAYELRPR